MMRDGRTATSSSLDHRRPVLPFLGDFAQHIAHDNSRCHQAMAFTLEDANFTPPHRPAQPPDIVHRNARVAAPVVDNDFSVNVNVTETNCLSALKADQQVHSWIGIGCRQFPDPVRQSGIIFRLAFAFSILRSQGSRVIIGTWRGRLVTVRTRRILRGSPVLPLLIITRRCLCDCGSWGLPTNALPFIPSRRLR